jgi:hypothetical protein
MLMNNKLVEIVSKACVIVIGSSCIDDPRKGRKNAPYTEPRNPLVANNSI